MYICFEEYFDKLNSFREEEMNSVAPSAHFRGKTTTFTAQLKMLRARNTEVAIHE